MRTKTLAVCAALTAAGAISAMAQTSNVYSLNIVGYANVSAPGGFTFHSNPFDVGTNGANEVIPNGTGTWDGNEIHEWTGVGFRVSVFDSSTDDTTTGFTDRVGNPVAVPILGSNKGYLFNNLGSSNVITYVGNVRGPATNTFSYPGSTQPVAVGSSLPLAGNPFQLGFDNSAGALDAVEIETLLRAPNGNAAGFLVSVFDSSTDDTTTGFTDRPGNQVPAPIISIGQGFFLHNPNGTPAVWTQILTNSP